MFSRLFGRRKKAPTASIAKERLQIIVAHERIQNTRKNPDFLTDLQKDILAVVRKYIPVDSEQIKVAMDQEDGCDVLELNIVLSDISDVNNDDTEDPENSSEEVVSNCSQVCEDEETSEESNGYHKHSKKGHKKNRG